MKKHWGALPVFAPPEAQSSSDPLAIADMRTWRLREPDSHREYLILRLTAHNGVTGYGEGAPVTRGEIAEAKAAVIGRAPTEAEYIRYHLAHLPAMEAAVSNAMLDLAAKSAGIPIYQYLGGPTRYKARVLAHLDAKDDGGLRSGIGRAKERGYKAFTLPLPQRDAMTKIQEHIDAIRHRVEQFRASAGDDTDFVLDGAGSLTPGDAAAIATALEKLHVLWFDEPTAVLTTDQVSKITDESVMPVGLGRNVHDVGVFQDLLRWGCVDVLRPSVGLNSSRKIRRMAVLGETHYVAVAPYHDGGPIGTIAAIHLAASLPNFFIQQVPQPSSDRDQKMRTALASHDHESATDGFASLINRPGLGIEVNEAALAQYSEETL